MIRRREFISVLGGAAATWPLSLRAQQPAAKIARVGIIDDSPVWDAFRRGLNDLGYVERQNIAFEYRNSNGTPKRLAEAAAELVRRPVDAIATYGTPPTRAAKQATTTIPIVMIAIGDPVGSGLVTSFNRPGGNITGNSNVGLDLTAKRLQMLREVVPSFSRVAFLWNPDNASHPAQLADLQAAIQKLGMTFVPVSVRTSDEFDGAFAAIVRARADAFLMTVDPFHQRNIRRIIDFLAGTRVPGMFYIKENAVAGGLMSYGASLPDLFRRGAWYMHRILQGVKPADLPIEQPTKFDLVINLKTARALGLTVPDKLLALADEVIE